ncbi:MAG TPA: hypothetical protein DEA55_06800, partial [Rhodospirillaceae bacterium]|nr:hypothetical protein [Rhodospirillaceae bacterium]
DADFMNQIYARTFLEASREIVMNETALRKPDSVMEYSCYDQQMSVTAHRLGPIFSETHQFKNSLVDISGGIFGFVSNEHVPLISGL